MRLVCCLVLVLGGLQLACALKVAAWNIQTFGPKKANLPGALKAAINANKPKKDHRDPTPEEKQKAKDILEFIADVIRQYDIMLIQEVRAKTNKDGSVDVITALMTAVNLPFINTHVPKRYDCIFSDPLGRATSTHKERYLYIFKMSTVQYIGSRQYTPAAKRLFTRPPFLAEFQSKTDPNFKFVLIPQHAAPYFAACREIDGLVDVVTDVYTLAGNQNINILVLGDFNAACDYVKEEDWDDIRLFTQKNNFHWLIDDNMNTAVEHRSTVQNKPKKPCAYDRIVANTPMLQHVAIGGNGPMAGPVQFDLQWQLPIDPTSTANPPARIPVKEISDHFLVEVELK